MNRFKKIISLFLSLVMVCSLSVPTFAAEAEMPIPPVIDTEDFALPITLETELDLEVWNINDIADDEEDDWADDDEDEE